jgi:hypothetical protein
MSFKNKGSKIISDKTKEYRINKKINKSKIRLGQKTRNALIYPEDLNCNELPYGYFDKNNLFNSHKKENLNNNVSEEDLYNKNDEEEFDNEEYFNNDDKKDLNKIELNKKIDKEENSSEDDEFNDSYFDPIPYIKK